MCECAVSSPLFFFVHYPLFQLSGERALARLMAAVKNSNFTREENNSVFVDVTDFFFNASCRKGFFFFLVDTHAKVYCAHRTRSMCRGSEPNRRVQINLRRFAWPGIMQTQLMDLINSHEYDQDADWPLFF